MAGIKIGRDAEERFNFENYKYLGYQILES